MEIDKNQRSLARVLLRAHPMSNESWLAYHDRVSATVSAHLASSYTWSSFSLVQKGP